MKALILSGGSIKGAFQAGAIHQLLNSGFVPDYIWGVSVGALNGSFLADRAGRAIAQGKEPNWPEIGKELKDFWLNEIKRPSNVVRKRRRIEIGWRALTGKFNGFVSIQPLQKLVQKTIKQENIIHSPVKFAAGVVNLSDGEFFNADIRFPKLVDYIISSSAIPVVMPTQFINGAALVDGGIRDIAPLKHALKAGATEIVVIACQAAKLQAEDFRPGSLFSLMDRVVEIMTDEILQNDLQYCQKVNKYLPVDGQPAVGGFLAGKQRVKVTSIRPKRNPGIDILQFKKSEIAELLQVGEVAAQIELGARLASVA